MAEKLNAQVILARCSKEKKLFGIRVEQRENDWVRTWAFPLDEHKAKREGFDANTITGSLNTTNEYPGCPYCGDKGLTLCYCKKIGCLSGARYICPWCGETFQTVETNSIEVSGGGY